MDEKSPEKSIWKRQYPSWAFGLIFLVVPLGLLFVFAERTPPGCIDSANGAALAYVMSQQFVKDRLKAPATTDFPAYGNVKAEYLGGCKHKVVGYVDSQNALGANIRTHYTAVVRYVDKDIWQLDALIMN
jgi:hypothetical protein